MKGGVYRMLTIKRLYTIVCINVIDNDESPSNQGMEKGQH